jgi:hypothetical protein
MSPGVETTDVCFHRNVRGMGAGVAYGEWGMKPRGNSGEDHEHDNGSHVDGCTDREPNRCED